MGGRRTLCNLNRISRPDMYMTHQSPEKSPRYGLSLQKYRRCHGRSDASLRSLAVDHPFPISLGTEREHTCNILSTRLSSRGRSVSKGSYTQKINVRNLVQPNRYVQHTVHDGLCWPVPRWRELAELRYLLSPTTSPVPSEPCVHLSNAIFPLL